MRMIQVSTDVFAALWAKRQPAEDNENAILERLLGLPKGPEVGPPVLVVQSRGGERQPRGDGGIHNGLFNVHFPPGFEIFRTYKGKRYSATVREGRWIMNGEAFPSLFALSMAIVDSRENPWVHWRYRDEDGKDRVIRDLRRITPQLEKYLQQEGLPDANTKPPRKKNAGKRSG